MKKLAVSNHFQRQLRKLDPLTQGKVVQTLKSFLSALQSNKVSGGFGFKKINGDKYEIRVDLRTRVVLKRDGDTFVCHRVGDHESVKKFLREYRNQ